MKNSRFNRPVIIQLGRIDRDRVVATPADAGRILLREWRDMNCPVRRDAVVAVLETIRGEQPPQHARAAFIEAAKAAKVYLGEA